MPGVGTFLYEQLFVKPVLPVLPEVGLSGRTVIVTGSNVGLGLQTAIHLARLSPARLILAVRDTEKGGLASKMIEEVTPFRGVEVWKLDLASFASVRAFAEQCDTELERLDIVVENAGVATERFEKTDDGWEKTIQVNDLSTGLLAVLLLPLLAKTALLPAIEGSTLKPHLCIVGSEVHHFAKFAEQHAPGNTLEALNDEGHHVPADRYNVSKLLNIFIAQQIAQLPLASGIVVNVNNPGLCVSELRKEMTGVVAYVLDTLARTAEVGAMTITWAAVSDTPPGAYTSCSRVSTASAWSRSEEGLAMEKKVWGEMVQVWKAVAPGVEEILS